MKRVWNNPIISDLTIKQTEATCIDFTGKESVRFSNKVGMVYHEKKDVSGQCCRCYNYWYDLCTIKYDTETQTLVRNVQSCSA